MMAVRMICYFAWTSGLQAEPSIAWPSHQKSDHKNLTIPWQITPLTSPIGGEKFAGSAFLHPLRTPSGFEWTSIQPLDHLHHFGLWWPWKYIEVDGEKFNCWEIQEGQGGNVARTGNQLSHTPKHQEWEFHNETMIKKNGAAPTVAIYETARVGLTVEGDTQVLDISIDQKAASAPVKIVNYRYSGFSWRGPLSWNNDNSTMTTSANLDRDQANSKPARWVIVSGPTPSGQASVLIMSAAIQVAGTTEKLRVWDSTMHDGMPFINFNPVMKNAQPLDNAHPAVSKRKYRVIAADHKIETTEAETAWKKWLETE